MGAKRWEPWEDEIIKEYYPSEGTDVIHRLEHRSRSSIQNRASLLMVRFYNKAFPSRPPFYEDVMLEYVDGEISLAEAAILLDISLHTLKRFIFEDEEIMNK